MLTADISVTLNPLTVAFVALTFVKIDVSAYKDAILEFVTVILVPVILVKIILEMVELTTFRLSDVNPVIILLVIVLFVKLAFVTLILDEVKFNIFPLVLVKLVN